MPIVATMKDVHHAYGRIPALRGVNLAVRRGEVLAVLGPNGAGKTTGISLLLGLFPAQRGHVEVFGHAPSARATRLRRGAMLQIAGLTPTLRVAEHIELFRSYYANPLPLAKLVKTAALDGLEQWPFGALSGGQQRRVMFALALAGDPELVFLDEPTSGLDLEARRRLWGEIRRLAETGRTVVLTTHYLEEADALADRIVVIHKGQAITEGTPAQIKARTAGRRLRCITTITCDELRRRADVATAAASGQHVEVLTSEPEELLRWMLSADPKLRDLSVSGAGLEQAFLTLTEEAQDVA
jgi:ABC-2 type transport system ATP-binding protein